MSPPHTTPRYAWMNGQLIPWDQCVLHCRTQGAFFGANIFEGLRAYWNAAHGELYIFKLQEHLQRMAFSMKTMRMKAAMDMGAIARGAIELLSANGFREDSQFNVVASFGFNTNPDPLHPTEDLHVHITAIPFPPSPKNRTGVSAGISSWRRIRDDIIPPRVKVGSNYQNSRLAQNEARVNGYDTALFLNDRGTMAEGPGSCLMMVRDGQLFTPPVTSGILESITRATLMTLCQRELGLSVHEREIDRTELYIADEVFLCGSIAEVLPVTSVDRIAVGTGGPGPLTKKLQELYLQAARGELPRYQSWLTPLHGSRAVAAHAS